MEPTLPSPRLGDRSLFPALEARAYLNHAAISPPSQRVQAAVVELMSRYAAQGVGALSHSLEQRERLRQRLAALVGAAPDELGYVANTTAGVRAVALCVPWRARDRVVLLDGEFPANVTPWQRAAELFGLRLSWLRAQDFFGSLGAGLQTLEDALRLGARMVAVSAVQFQTGLRMPLAEIGALCRAHGAELFVDAIQGCGVVPIDVEAMQIDYLSCGSHKWLMGLEGVAFVYARRERAAALRPVVAGWLSHEEGLRFLFEGAGHLRYDRPIRARADLVEGGATPNILFAALEASVEPIAALGVPAILEHVGAYDDALERGLLERGFGSERSPIPAQRSGILAVQPPAGVELGPLHQGLQQRGIACTTPDGRLRFAPHWPNSLTEIDAVLAAVDETIASGARLT
ncbi:aminotransferase class V-fold PLP-dependent enzyme [Paraliomyxa miuraensis]|uniref:aminotransferase class V-fold PLP-dependent enzyme n=1 Tax=Paraliomyxa miuraensis TaxID=376150 RepID=UPI00225AF564|nr:aminotransferase class V-fold PLP-dependent enzyme [Paraliomyxa miuraensis]MCX4245329.1 aminotransferase class V-fold PLP-dependent enzyme [Paraliomyxa miuraensis]